MPTIINPFQGVDPIAQALSDFGTATFGNKGAGELRKQQILDLDRKNTETTNLGKMIAQAGAAAALKDPTGQAMLFSSGYDPKNFNDLVLGSSAQNYGATDPRTVNAQIGAGESYTSTAPAFNATLNENKRQFDMVPTATIGPDGNPVYATRAGAIGQQPVLSETEVQGTKLGQNWDNLGTLSDLQQRALGVAPKGASQTPHNYVAPDGTTKITYDGVTDAQTGQPLPPGGFIATAQGSASDVGLTNTTKTNIDSSLIAQNNFSALADTMLGLAQTHPEAFGLNGQITGGVQEVAQAADVLIGQMGGKQAYDKMLTDTQQLLQANGASTDILSHYNPAIPAVNTLGPLLATQAAAAIAQQSGRSLSDNDIKLFTGIVGDPQGWLSSAQQVQTKLGILKATVEYSRQMALDYRSKGVEVPADLASQALAKAVADIANQGGSLTAPATTPPQAATDQPAEGDTATGADGRKAVLRGGQWVDATTGAPL